MALLNDNRMAPPDGWRFTQPETGARFTGGFKEELLDVIIAHRIHKGLTPTDRVSVGLEVERQLCMTLPPYCCHAEPGEDFKPIEDKHRSLTSEMVVAFTRSAYKFIESGFALVDKKESERRAAICRGCPFNRPSVCVCTPVHKLLDAMIPESRREPGLFICGVCGCGIGPKVLLPLQTLRDDEANKNLTYPVFCWIRGSNSNGQTQAT